MIKLTGASEYLLNLADAKISANQRKEIEFVPDRYDIKNINTSL